MVAEEGRRALASTNSMHLVRSRKKIPLKWHFRQEFLVRLPRVVQPPVYLGTCGGYAGGLRGSMPPLRTDTADRLRSKG